MDICINTNACKILKKKKKINLDYYCLYLLSFYLFSSLGTSEVINAQHKLKQAHEEGNFDSKNGNYEPELEL